MLVIIKTLTALLYVKIAHKQKQMNAIISCIPSFIHPFLRDSLQRNVILKCLIPLEIT